MATSLHDHVLPEGFSFPGCTEKELFEDAMLQLACDNATAKKQKPSTRYGNTFLALMSTVYQGVVNHTNVEGLSDKEAHDIAYAASHIFFDLDEVLQPVLLTGADNNSSNGTIKPARKKLLENHTWALDEAKTAAQNFFVVFPSPTGHYEYNDPTGVPKPEWDFVRQHLKLYSTDDELNLFVQSHGVRRMEVKMYVPSFDNGELWDLCQNAIHKHLASKGKRKLNPDNVAKLGQMMADVDNILVNASGTLKYLMSQEHNASKKPKKIAAVKSATRNAMATVKAATRNARDRLSPPEIKSVRSRRRAPLAPVTPAASSALANPCRC